MPKGLSHYSGMTKYTRPIMDFNSTVWNKKKGIISSQTGKPLSLKDSIANIVVPSELDLFKEDLTKMHNILP
jgi:hypothetical protein